VEGNGAAVGFAWEAPAGLESEGASLATLSSVSAPIIFNLNFLRYSSSWTPGNLQGKSLILRVYYLNWLNTLSLRRYSPACECSHVVVEKDLLHPRRGSRQHK